jgi:toluene monooxygenase system ferredoxin subunit
VTLTEPVLAEADLWIGEMRAVQVQGEHLLVVRGEGGVCVFRDRCPHQGYPLSEGTLEDGVLTCRVHRHSFDAASGDGINPLRPCLSRVPARVEAGQIVIELPEPAEPGRAAQ